MSSGPIRCTENEGDMGKIVKTKEVEFQRSVGWMIAEGLQNEGNSFALILF
jgi:hypothetical protein